MLLQLAGDLINPDSCRQRLDDPIPRRADQPRDEQGCGDDSENPRQPEQPIERDHGEKRGDAAGRCGTNTVGEQAQTHRSAQRVKPVDDARLFHNNPKELQITNYELQKDARDAVLFVATLS